MDKWKETEDEKNLSKKQHRLYKQCSVLQLPLVQKKWYNTVNKNHVHKVLRYSDQNMKMCRS